MVIETMPDYVDKMIIIDDCSRDRTVEVVKGYQRGNPKIVLIAHEANQGWAAPLRRLQVGQRQ
jgi:glycosyltransferase involved in cell wall biosynthesis